MLRQSCRYANLLVVTANKPIIGLSFDRLRTNVKTA